MGTPFNNGETENTDGPTINPAWTEMLGVIPQEMHEQVLPHLTKWDTGVTERFNTLNETYKSYDEYKDFVESKISPQDLKMGYGLLQAIHADPLKVIGAMRDSMNLDLASLINPVDPNAEAVEYAKLSPEVQNQLAALQRQTELQSQILLKQREDEMAREQQKVLDKQFADAKTKYGQFDEEIVLTLMLHGNYTVDKAVERYLAHNTNLLAARNAPPAPQLLGGGNGGIPNTPVDPTKLTNKATNHLVAKILEDAARARNNA